MEDELLGDPVKTVALDNIEPDIAPDPSAKSCVPAQQGHAEHAPTIDFNGNSNHGSLPGAGGMTPPAPQMGTNPNVMYMWPGMPIAPGFFEYQTPNTVTLMPGPNGQQIISYNPGMFPPPGGPAGSGGTAFHLPILSNPAMAPAGTIQMSSNPLFFSMPDHSNQQALFQAGLHPSANFLSVLGSQNLNNDGHCLSQPVDSPEVHNPSVACSNSEFRQPADIPQFTDVQLTSPSESCLSSDPVDRDMEVEDDATFPARPNTNVEAISYPSQLANTPETSDSEANDLIRQCELKSIPEGSSSPTSDTTGPSRPLSTSPILTPEDSDSNDSTSSSAGSPDCHTEASIEVDLWQHTKGLSVCVAPTVAANQASGQENASNSQAHGKQVAIVKVSNGKINASVDRCETNEVFVPLSDPDMPTTLDDYIKSLGERGNGYGVAVTVPTYAPLDRLRILTEGQEMPPEECAGTSDYPDLRYDFMHAMSLPRAGEFVFCPMLGEDKSVQWFHLLTPATSPNLFFVKTILLPVRKYCCATTSDAIEQ